jgi:Bacteriophage Gp15 protein.
MKWDEFCALLSGLSPESPLGRIVQIRAENDPKILKNFTVHQRKIRNEWRNKKALKVSEKTMDSVLNSIKNGFIALSGGVTNGG